MFLLVFLVTSVVNSLPVDHPDRVINLPGAPLEPSFPLYSGYLDVTENSTQHKVFYVLAEAIHTNPLESPLIVWLNGGPGASSLLGFLMENGPFLYDTETGQLRYNDFSWNQYANVLYIESPTGVGFSHSNDSKSHFTNDDSTGILNRKALQDFMTRVHPRYSTRDFYISGESYAGAYIPYFTREIMGHLETGEFRNPNLKGIAMGNAGVDDFSNFVAASLQMYSMGMIPEEHAETIMDLWKRTLKGENVREEISGIYYNAAIPLGVAARYNLPLECNKDEQITGSHVDKSGMNLECKMEEISNTYFNREDVQIALHARTKAQDAIDWKMWKPIPYYQDIDTIHIYREIFAIAPTGFRILFYTGDMDLICPPLQVAFGARRIAQENNMTTVSSSEANWKFLGDHGGARTSYVSEMDGISMDVITVRGAGHMVPTSTPDRAFQIINNFITAPPGAPVDYSKMIPRK